MCPWRSGPTAGPLATHKGGAQRSPRLARGAGTGAVRHPASSAARVRMPAWQAAAADCRALRSYDTGSCDERSRCVRRRASRRAPWRIASPSDGGERPVCSGRTRCARRSCTAVLVHPCRQVRVPSPATAVTDLAGVSGERFTGRRDAPRQAWRPDRKVWTATTSRRPERW
jgi:hypothetical protein